MEIDAEYEARLRRRLVRPLIAFLTACLFSSSGFLILLGLAWNEYQSPESAAGNGLLLEISLALNLMAVAGMLAFSIAMVASIPAAIAVFLMRRTRIVRGLTDMLAGGLIGGVAAHLLLGNGLRLSVEVTPETLGFSACGLLGGLVYWIFAGRPRPPYSQA